MNGLGESYMIPENYQAWIGLDNNVDDKGFSDSKAPLDHTTNIDSDCDDVDYVDEKSSSQSEPYGKNHPIEKMSNNLIEDVDIVYEKEETDEENSDAEISMLFQDAIVKLEEIKAYSNQQKKQIVVELAKDLEGKIPTDTICMEIVTQLRGRVSERFVRECLDEKYKQKPRVENARKQKKQNYGEDKEEDTDELAAVAPLNQELENDKIILVGTHGQELVQRDGENNGKPSSDTDDDFSEDNTESLTPNLSYQKGHEQQLGPKDEPVSLSECPRCKEICYENIELREIVEKQNQFTAADKMKNANDTNNDVKTPNNILGFEFCKPYWELSQFVGSFLRFGNSAEVWFSGTIDTSTGKVVSSGYGRIKQHHQEQGPLASESNDEDEWEVVE